MRTTKQILEDIYMDIDMGVLTNLGDISALIQKALSEIEANSNQKGESK